MPGVGQCWTRDPSGRCRHPRAWKRLSRFGMALGDSRSPAGPLSGCRGLSDSAFLSARCRGACGPRVNDPARRPFGGVKLRWCPRNRLLHFGRFVARGSIVYLRMRTDKAEARASRIAGTARDTTAAPSGMAGPAVSGGITRVFDRCSCAPSIVYLQMRTDGGSPGGGGREAETRSLPFCCAAASRLARMK
jgi:hypothetical protein